MTASMAFCADGNTIVRLCEYGTVRTPLLTLDGEGHSLTVSAFDRVPIAEHLTFARELAAACADYVRALETYAAALPDGETDRDERP
ncbi:hypothetical protein SAMN04487983_1007170 [Streptomyces sp. yr375]|uniref:hypothetical protein n=1 Tax=Streptomyces sp. yr375 TaxID=1761906 RepID=UPI0008B1F69F|nr:hypothetical protein [Streptomyces sp. yr375]SEQ71691.1 hypothetical protein SAMN04487983_1007170 [Streptomyces sp. yr375]